MEKYIKANTVLNFINSCLEHEDKITDIEKAVLTGVKTCVERISAEDVVEVVRCRDCKHRIVYEYSVTPSPIWPKARCDMDIGEFFYPVRNANDDNWYCADGKRKDGGQDDV